MWDKILFQERPGQRDPMCYPGGVLWIDGKVVHCKFEELNADTAILNMGQGVWSFQRKQGVRSGHSVKRHTSCFIELQPGQGRMTLQWGSICSIETFQRLWRVGVKLKIDKQWGVIDIYKIPTQYNISITLQWAFMFDDVTITVRLFVWYSLLCYAAAKCTFYKRSIIHLIFLQTFWGWGQAWRWDSPMTALYWVSLSDSGAPMTAFHTTRPYWTISVWKTMVYIFVLTVG